MANNLTEVMPKLLAQGLLVLRKYAIMPRIVNRAYETLAGEKGSTVDVPIPSAITASDVAPAAYAANPGDVVPTKVSIPMTYWREAAFQLSDKDLMEVVEGTIPMQASAAVQALGDDIDQKILALYKKVYGYAGTAGTTPFGTDVQEYLDGRKVLANQLAPLDPRYTVIDPTAEANALGLRAFQDSNFGKDAAEIVRGQMGSKLGALWVADQNVPTHTAGTGSGYLVNNGAGYAAGIKTITVDTGSGTLLEGDIISFAGHSSTYTVVSTVGGGTVTSITFEPGLATSIADNEAITKRATHVVNMTFHRDAFALAMRPFSGSDPLGLGNFQSMVDPVTGLVMRLEVSREHKRTRFSFDVLYGVACIRPELAARIAG